MPRRLAENKDVILFNSENGCFDPLHYEWTRKGRGAGDLESIIDLFSTLVSLSKPDGGHRRTPFGSGAVSS